MSNESKWPQIKWLIVLIILGLLSINNFERQPQLDPLPSDATILALGDSLTYGTGVARDDSYPSVLEELTGLKVINAGIPGETSDGTLSRIDDVIEKHLPDLVILCIGGNDILRRRDKARIVNNIQGMIDIAEKNDIQIILLAVPEFGLFLTAPDFYQELADENDIPLDNDTIPEVLRDNSLKSDAIHGNEAGYRVIAENVYRLLEQAGAITAKAR